MEFVHFVTSALAAPTKELIAALHRQVELDQAVGLIEMQAQGTAVLRAWHTEFLGFAQKNLPIQYWDTEKGCIAGYKEIDLIVDGNRFTKAYLVCSGTGVNLERENGGSYSVSWDGSDPELKFTLGKILGFDGSLFEVQYRTLQSELSQRYERVLS